ncbi:MAG: hypothetical protein ACFBRM_10770 [Pikeienuella sp.]
MLFILLATLALGLGAAGLVFIAGKLTGGAVPSWVAPAAGGLAMFAFMIWNEYTWYARAQAALPPDSRIAQVFEHRSPFQPWTLVAPRVVRFAAVNLRRRELQGVLVGQVILRERFQGERRLPHLFDCAGHRRAALSVAEWEGIGSGYPPLLETLDWIDAGAQDPLLSAACNDGAPNPEDRP